MIRADLFGIIQASTRNQFAAKSAYDLEFFVSQFAYFRQTGLAFYSGHVARGRTNLFPGRRPIDHRGLRHAEPSCRASRGSKR